MLKIDTHLDGNLLLYRREMWLQCVRVALVHLVGVFVPDSLLSGVVHGTSGQAGLDGKPESCEKKGFLSVPMVVNAVKLPQHDCDPNLCCRRKTDETVAEILFFSFT